MYCFLIVSTETLLRVPTASKPHISSVSEKEVVNEHHEEISPGIEKSKTDVIATPFEEKGDVSEREMAKKQEERKHSPEVVSENSVHVEERGSVFVLQLLLLFNAMKNFWSRCSYCACLVTRVVTCRISFKHLVR